MFLSPWLWLWWHGGQHLAFLTGRNVMMILIVPHSIIHLVSILLLARNFYTFALSFFVSNIEGHLNLLYMLHFTCVKYYFFTTTPKSTFVQLQVSISSTDSRWAVYGVCSAHWDLSPAMPCGHLCTTSCVSASQVLCCPTRTVFLYMAIVIRIINITCCLK